MRLRAGGASYDDIADALKLTPAQASKAVKRALARVKEELKESSDEVLTTELLRLDMLFLHAMNAVKRGDLSAIDKAVKVMDRRARFLGLDADMRAKAKESDGFPDLSEDDVAAIELALRKAEGGDHEAP